MSSRPAYLTSFSASSRPASVRFAKARSMRRPAPLQVVAAANAGNNDCTSRRKLCITFSNFTTAEVKADQDQHAWHGATSSTEGVGFEPTVGFPTLDFESSALN